MEAVLLDTDVFSYLLKDDSRAEFYRKHIQGKTLGREEKMERNKDRES